MVNRAQPFRHHDVKRAFRAAVAAGVPNPSVEVRLPTGTTITIGSGGKPDAPASAASGPKPPATASSATAPKPASSAPSPARSATYKPSKRYASYWISPASSAKSC